MSGFMSFASSGAGQAAGGVLSSLVSSIASSITANRQNRKNRQFQASQAQLARDWQEDMYNKYSSPSAMVKQYKDAGLNPALALGGQGQTFTGTSGMTSGSQMMPDYSGLDLSGLFTTLAELGIKKEVGESEVNRNNAAAEKDRADAAGTAIDNQFKSSHWQKKIDELDASIEKIRADKGASDARAALDTSAKLLNEALADKELFLSLKANEEYLKEKWANKFRDENGYSPDTNIMNAFPTFISSVFNDMGISTFGYQEIIDAAKRQLQKIKDKMNNNSSSEKND